MSAKCPKCGHVMLQAETVARFVARGGPPIRVMSLNLRGTWCASPDCQIERVEIVPDYKPRPGFPDEEHP